MITDGLPKIASGDQVTTEQLADVPSRKTHLSRSLEVPVIYPLSLFIFRTPNEHSQPKNSKQPQTS